MNQQNNFSAIDCGIGDLSYGLKKSGIPVLAGIDSDTSCKYAYESNNNADFIGDDISSVKGKKLLRKYWGKTGIKILVGCAPCQPFSTHANKIKEEDKESGHKWNLLNELARLIVEMKPEIVSMENVPNLANKKNFKNSWNY
jgi:DNA (cytosine-5)-methyltransferase 1